MLKQRIMRRVYAIWFVKQVLPWLVLHGVLMATVLYTLAERVFINHMLQNAALHTFARSPSMFAYYFFRAFLNTEILVQILVVGSLLFGTLIARDLWRCRPVFLNRSDLSSLIAT